MFNPSLITHKEFSWFLYSILRPYISYYVYTACVSSCLFTLSYNYLRSNYLTASVHGVMGGAWLAPNLDELLAHPETKAVLMKTVRMLDTHEEIIGLSGHLLAVSKKAVCSTRP